LGPDPKGVPGNPYAEGKGGIGRGRILADKDKGAVGLVGRGGEPGFVSIQASSDLQGDLLTVGGNVEAHRIGVGLTKAKADPARSHQVPLAGSSRASYVEVQVSIVVEICQSQPTHPLDARGLSGRGKTTVWLLQLEFQALVHDAHEVRTAIAVEVFPVGFVGTVFENRQ
jgi:hypothetical protein